MTLGTIVRKELADLVREKRFGGWALAFLSFWAIFLVVFIEDAQMDMSLRREYPQGILSLALPFYFFFSLAFLVLALFVLSDGITKERESGMLPVVGAKPIVRWHLLMGKLVAGVAVYIAAALISLLPVGVLAYMLGAPLLTYTLELFAGPFLALYVFMMGLGLLLGVVSSSSKVAIGTAAGLYLPLFLLIQEGPMQLIYRNRPELGVLASYTPFDAALQATSTLAYGGVMPWAQLAVTITLGLVLAVAAFVVFERQEVAA